MAFGILGVVFFQYTISVIEQKSSGWEALRRTLPISQLERFFVKLILFSLFGVITGAVVFILAFLNCKSVFKRCIIKIEPFVSPTNHTTMLETFIALFLFFGSILAKKRIGVEKGY